MCSSALYCRWQLYNLTLILSIPQAIIVYIPWPLTAVAFGKLNKQTRKATTSLSSKYITIQLCAEPVTSGPIKLYPSL